MNQAADKPTKKQETVKPDASEEKDVKKSAWANLKKQGKAEIVIAGVVLVLALLAGGVAYALYGQSAESESLVAVDVEDIAATTSHVSVRISCEGWDEETSTPIVVAIYEGDVTEELASVDEDAEMPEAIGEISLSANEETVLEDIVDAGTYTLAIISTPELENGAAFIIPDPEVIEYDGESSQTITFELTTVESDDGHTHNWETNYVLEQVDAVTHTVYHEAEYEEVTTYHTVCNTCLSVIDGEAISHINSTGHSGYSTNIPITNEVLVTAAYTETVVDEEAYYTLVADGQRCSICEETRNTSDA